MLVIVVGDDVREQLRPFRSNVFNRCPEEYLVFKDEEDAYHERYLTEGFGQTTGEYMEHSGESYREAFATFDYYMEEFYGPRDQRTGRYGRWFNPNEQYVGYEVGGSFSGHLILKPGREALSASPDDAQAVAPPGRANVARKGDIDFQATSREWDSRLLDAWEELGWTGGTTNRPEKWALGIPETIKKEEQLIAYAQGRPGHNAPAAVVSGGEWFGPWWVPDGPTEEAADRWRAWYAALLASLPDDILITVVDCLV